jgi:hypothetical protein
MLGGAIGGIVGVFVWTFFPYEANKGFGPD